MAYSSPSPHLMKFIRICFLYASISSLYMFYNNKKDIVFLLKTMPFLFLYLYLLYLQHF
ncbi:polysaccharide deacetylase [Bacillus luti]|uniref:Polysaccharide deacetylase n=1 Tax=Bacillus luti TaxID=2026191 RepID=A0A7V7S4L2_9BACI|nr:polysaccharide deacetylase [Bacillus luti]